jgi:threonine synthase
MSELGRVGIFSEPAGATAYAGFLKAIEHGILGPEDAILVLNTGSGLKDVGAAMKAVNPAPIIEPTLAAVEKELNGINLSK